MATSFVESVFDSLWQPGLNTPMRQAMNFSFYGLFIVLLGLLFLTGGNIHVVFLLTLSLGLFVSIQWFLKEMDKLPPSATQVQQMPSVEGDDDTPKIKEDGSRAEPQEDKKHQ